MKYFFISTSLIWLFILLFSCKVQTNVSNQVQETFPLNLNQVPGGEFENREFTYLGIPKNLSYVDTSASWGEDGQKILLTGKVFQQDGKTPASNVLMYYYHTNNAGRYIHKPEMEHSMPPNELGQTHGYIRGWVKTNTKGQYFIYTTKPGTYPTHDEPAHIHATIKEPNEINEYYIDDFVFDDDKFLSSSKRKKMENRCGSGVLRMIQKGDLFIGERNLILGLNIPNYPNKTLNEIISGKNIGEDIISFIPIHASGPDKGTKTCPICKYGWYHGILYFVGNHPNWDEIRQWLLFLEKESIQREKYLKIYFVYGNEIAYDKNSRGLELQKLATELKLKITALTFVPSFSDSESEINENRINPSVENTIMIYKRSKIVDKFVNLKPTTENYNLIQLSLDNSINEYFYFEKPKL